MSFFSNITGFNASAIREFANQKDIKTEENEKVDYSGVDYCVGNDEFTSFKNISASEEDIYSSYDSDFEITSKYMDDDSSSRSFNIES